MRRRISLLLAAALAGTTLMLFGPTQPASAIVLCAGAAGTVTVAPGLLYPVLFGVGDPVSTTGTGGKDHFIDILVFNQTNITHGFSVSFLAGACVHPPSTTPSNISGAGILKGYCGHSSGTGTVNGQPFSYVSAGTLLIVTGHVVGATNAIPTPGTGSCLHAEGPPTVTGQNPFALPSGATQFTLVGAAAVGLNCLNALPPIDVLVVLPEPTLFLPTQAFGVHVGPYVNHIWVTTPCVPQPLDHL